MMKQLNLPGIKNSRYDHRKIWDALDRDVTGGYGFDHYPRGRVKIRHGKASVYLSPEIDTERMREYIIKEFKLTGENGIYDIRFVRY